MVRRCYDAPETVYPVSFDKVILKKGTLSLTMPAKSVVMVEIIK